MPNTFLPIPEDAHELSASWLSAALREGGILPTGRVTDFQAVRFAQGIALLGKLFRIKLEYDGAPRDAPTQMVAKFPTDSPDNRALAVAYHFYLREVHFYRHLPGWARLAIPRCYYGAVDETGDSFVLLLEDLQGYTMFDQKRGADEKHVFAVVELAARMHAQFWGRLSETHHDWLIDPSARWHTSAVQGAYRAALPSVVRAFTARFSPALRDAAERLTDYVPVFWQKMSEPPTTLVHGDLRLDNLLFNDSAARAVLMLDFQITLAARGLYDIAYFMSQSVATEVRRSIEKEALRRYHTSLVQHGVRGYDFESCVRDYRRAVLYCLAYPVIVAGAFDPKDESAQAFGSIFLQRSLSAIEDCAAADLLREKLA